MRPVRRPIPLFIMCSMCSALGLAACGGGDDDDDGGSGSTVGQDNTYVLDSLNVPASPADVTQFGLDLTGDDMVDNKLGGLLATVAGQVDLAGAVSAQIRTGGIILLANLKATALDNATGVGLYVYLGADPNPAPCAGPEDTTCGLHLQGDATFTVDPASPAGAVIIGSNIDSRFVGGPGTVSIEISLGENVDPIVLRLVGARAQVDVSANSLMTGKLGGAITVDDITNVLIPAVAAVVTTLIATDCTGTGTPCGCDGGLETVRGILDANGDCTVTAEEANASSIAPILKAPDVDLLDASGNPGTDGTTESVSLGVGFSAVHGTFTPPP